MYVNGHIVKAQVKDGFLKKCKIAFFKIILREKTKVPYLFGTKSSKMITNEVSTSNS